jgi:hypothetical protein
MAYIRSDGTVVQGTRPPATGRIKKASKAFVELPLPWKAFVIVVAAVACRQWLRPNPFANGKIPAASVEPDQHWKRIKEDDFFVRTMTERLGQNTYWQGKKEEMQRLAEAKDPKDFDILLGGHDFGGPDGHIVERGDWADLKYIQGTRCTTTRSAITAYFCGARVAENQDVGMGENQKLSYYGVDSFSRFLSCRHKDGERNGSHRRSVYRLGIASKDPRAGYSHAFSIIAQPDGSFFWLQSFIDEYSLCQWMAKTNVDGSPHAHLSFEQLQAKLNQTIRLMNISRWTDQANQDYQELFGVNKEEDALNWIPDHRLQYFSWDEACEYPLPSNTIPGEVPSTADSTAADFDLNDQCILDTWVSKGWIELDANHWQEEK